MENEVQFDWDRQTRALVPEAVLCEGKTVAQVQRIVLQAFERKCPLLLTRLSAQQADALKQEFVIDYEEQSMTGIVGKTPDANADECDIAVVCAGTSDLPTALEAQRCLRFFGLKADLIADVGVAGLWRLQKVLPQLKSKRVIIAVAGMEGALFSVLAGLVPAMIIAVPAPVGYGVSKNGEAALSSALSSCAPGVVTVNIGNGFGAAAAAFKVVAVC